MSFVGLGQSASPWVREAIASQRDSDIGSTVWGPNSQGCYSYQPKGQLTQALRSVCPGDPDYARVARAGSGAGVALPPPTAAEAREKMLQAITVRERVQANPPTCPWCLVPAAPGLTAPSSRGWLPWLPWAVGGVAVAIVGYWLGRS